MLCRLRGDSFDPGTQGILKEHVLPRLEQLANTALWLHFAEEAVSFERGLSPLRGLPMPAGSDELAESTEEPWTDGSCLELLARQPVSGGSPFLHHIYSLWTQGVSY